MPVGLYNDIPQMIIYKVAEMPYDATLIMREVKACNERTKE